MGLLTSFPGIRKNKTARASNLTLAVPRFAILFRFRESCGPSHADAAESGDLLLRVLWQATGDRREDGRPSHSVEATSGDRTERFLLCLPWHLLDAFSHLCRDI